MTVLVNYAMFSIDPERLVNINTVNYEVNNIFNACKNLTRYLGFKKYFFKKTSEAQRGRSENCDRQ